MKLSPFKNGAAFTPSKRHWIWAAIWQISQALHKSHKPVPPILTCTCGTVAQAGVLALAGPLRHQAVALVPGVSNPGFLTRNTQGFEGRKQSVLIPEKLCQKKRRRMLRIQQYFSF